MPYNQATISQGRAPKPKLTVDTRSTQLKSVVQEPIAQSAPVGTRQEKGILPMYQAGDRHCAKIAEIMNSPSWRSHNAMKDEGTFRSRGMPNVQAPSTMGSCGEGRSRNDCHNATRPPAIEPSEHAVRHLEQNKQEKIHLGHGHEGLNILGIDDFAGTTEAMKNTFVITAAVPRRSLALQHALSNRDSQADNDALDMRVEGASVLDDMQRVAAEYAGSRPVPCHSARRSDLQTAHNQEPEKLLEQDEAIVSIKHQKHRLQSPPRHLPDSPGENQRFKGLLDRLHHQYPEKQYSDSVASLKDPAIIACIPKNMQSADSTMKTRQRRSDSGYASISDSLSRRPSRLSQRSSEETSLEVANTEDKKHVRMESGDSSLSKNSTLNPAAKEFSSTGVFSTGSHLSSRPSALSKIFVPQQQQQQQHNSGLSHFASIPQQPSAAAWVSSSSNFSNSPTSNQYSSIGLPYPHFNISGAGCCNSGSPAIVPTPGLQLPCGGMHGVSNVGVGLDWPAPALRPPIHTAPTCVVPGHFPGSIHQQVPPGFQCNVPAHQAFGAIQSHSLPAGYMPKAPMAQTIGGPTPFIPKHVPKPKSPDTASQQNWELMHELRRTNEPSYALKCKEKQKKRYLKQLEKNGSTSSPN